MPTLPGATKSVTGKVSPVRIEVRSSIAFHKNEALDLKKLFDTVEQIRASQNR